MRRRKLVITVAAAALFGVLVVPASAELHRVAVTLVTGQKVTLTVDVPPGTPVESIQIPGLPAPVQSIADLGPVSTATPSPTATASPAPTETPSQTATPSPTEPPGDDDARARGNKGGNKSGGKQGATQQPNPARPERRGPDRRARAAGRDARARRSTRPTRPATRTARRRSTTRPSRWPSRAPPASASRTSSSRSSASRPSCSRSTRPPASSTACAGRSWPRSTRSRPTTAAT